MSDSTNTSFIRLRGVRHNNLKNFDLDLPVGRLIVVTGLSGSGKSSLAFDTLYAEGQRRYIETFSPYARQFFDRMDKPAVDRIEGIPPAIAIEQRNTVKTTRSTIGTMTEICDYMKVLWPHLARLHCRQCGQPVRKDSPRQIWETVQSRLGTAGRADAGRGSPPGAPAPAAEILIAFDLPLSGKLSLEDSLALVSKQGYQRLLVPATRSEPPGDDTDALTLREAVAPYESKAPAAARPGVKFEIMRIDEATARLKQTQTATLTIIQDRLSLAPENRARFVEACEQAYHFGKGRLAIYPLASAVGGVSSAGAMEPVPFSRALHCAACAIDYRDPSPALFSFNNPVGACPPCRGFGRTITIDYNLAIPDRSLPLAGGAVKPWQTGTGADCQRDLAKACRHHGIPMNVPFRELSPGHQRWVIEGDPDYGKDDEHEWPRVWYGIKGYFRWLESKSYKMHVRVLLSRYRSYQTCEACGGKRFQPEALLYRMPLPEKAASGETGDGKPATVPRAGSRQVATPSHHASLTLSDFYALSVTEALRVIDLAAAARPAQRHDPLALALGEARSRLAYLEEVGLGYLTLDRPTRSLSGGETERVNLTTCLGSRLVNTLFVLDEPSVGLHPRDTERLIRILQRLRDNGNTVVVVEHEAAVMRAADQIVDLGPGHGESGGHLVFQGAFGAILQSDASLTGRYLSGRERVEIPERRPVTGGTPRLRLEGARLHNLKNLTVEFPLGRLLCVTGVSGSGKTTLIREVLLPLMHAKLAPPAGQPASDAASGEDETGETESPSVETAAAIAGYESLGSVVLVDQSPLGRTPRSNPAVYIGAFDDIREIFAQSDAAKQRGLNASAFSFNSSQGQCETCRGAGFEKIEMQFLSDVFIRCPECQGRRYREHILEVKLSRPIPAGTTGDTALPNPAKPLRRRPKSDRTADAPASPVRAWSIADALDATVDEMIGFLGGFGDSRPARRAVAKLQLLCDTGLGYLRLGQPINTLSGGESQRLKLVSHLAAFQDAGDTRQKAALFLFDEPTTGLHFDDVRVLMRVFQRLVDGGHTVLIIDHNLDVIKCADWVIDLGPEAGEAGGELVAAGTPEALATSPASHTGRALKTMPGNRRR